MHGYGRRGRGGGASTRLRKIAYATEGEAADQALLMDLRHGTAFEAFPCRWGEDYRAGQTAPLHWHVGRPGLLLLDDTSK